MKYQLKKVFKLFEMPIEVQMHFQYLEVDYYGFHITEPIQVKERTGYSLEVAKKHNLINDYLLSNGAVIDEKVIIDLNS